MSALGHVWTAPWQELSDVVAALVGCGHVSGLLMRRMCEAAGSVNTPIGEGTTTQCRDVPLVLMLCADRVPIASFRGSGKPVWVNAL